MIRVEKVNENNKQQLINSIRQDVIKHVFAFYDIQHAAEHTTTHAAFENSQLKGYVLIYTATEPQSVILECEERLAETLLEFAPSDHFIMHAPVNLLSAAKKKFPNSEHYVENWMLVKKGEANLFKSKYVRRLRTGDDASKLANLTRSRQDRSPGSLKKYVDWLSKMPIYGVFEKEQLVSYAGSFLQLPQVWMIGGVFTHPEHRNRGFATLAASAVTAEALKTADAAALFVRSDNYAAIKVYEKIGYRKIGEKLWIDVGTGLKP
jgi:GNAT superfamily N-acetyltransferase